VARITGVAVHPNGTPALGAVEIEPLNVENAPAVATISLVDGSFATEKLPAGKYRVGVDLGINRQPDEAYGRSYFPGTPDPEKATEVEIIPGLPDPHIRFTVPELRPSVNCEAMSFLQMGRPPRG
jgi:hypothetical protein